jgi:hypothetical protein
MPQLSRKKLRPDVENRVRELLATCIQRCQEAGTTENFIEVVLTDTEKLMIAKRVAIALMVLKSYKLSEITETLNVTASTARSVAVWLDRLGKEFVSLLSKIADEDQKKADNIEELENEAYGYQPRYGTNWKAARRQKWEEVNKQRPPVF